MIRDQNTHCGLPKRWTKWRGDTAGLPATRCQSAITDPIPPRTGEGYPDPTWGRSDYEAQRTHRTPSTDTATIAASDRHQQTTQIVQQPLSLETYRAQGTSVPTSRIAHVEAAAAVTAYPSSELGAHKEEILHSLPYTQGDRAPADPCAHNPGDGINGNWARAPTKASGRRQAAPGRSDTTALERIS
ncbi:Hypothetical predicted protein [Pelobates cultripes]|uniref:Uncharacterized protein n=1 Tax=Pelobates cultripes TaxID=61616 RepID=A0AAD1REW8_PELCU|nr:Hypothetical predicted protein [Pelobates cultripes]